VKRAASSRRSADSPAAASGARRKSGPLRWWWEPTAAISQIPFGVAWFASLVLAIWLGVWPLAFLVGAVAAWAAYDVANAWSEQITGADAPLAALIAGLAAPVAAFHTAAFGALVVAGAAVTLLGASVQRRANSLMPQVGATVQSWLPVAIASASVVLAYRYEVGAAVWLICLSAIYDVGHYLVGAGAPQQWEGPIAGAIGVAIVAFALVTIGVPPLDEAAGLRFGAVALVLLPAGVVMASLILPDARAVAPGLRRIDSWLLFAPMWAWAVGRHLDGFV